MIYGSPEKNLNIQLYDPHEEGRTKTGCVNLKWEGLAVKSLMSYISYRQFCLYSFGYPTFLNSFQFCPVNPCLYGCHPLCETCLTLLLKTEVQGCEEGGLICFGSSDWLCVWSTDTNKLGLVSFTVIFVRQSHTLYAVPG